MKKDHLYCVHWEKFYISRNSRTKQFFTLQAKKFARWSSQWPLNKVLIFSCFEQIRPPPNLKKAGFNKKVEFNIYMAKYKRFKKIAWIWSHHLHLQWKFKLWAGKFAPGVKAKHCWSLSTNFWKQKVCWHHPAMFCLITLSKLSHQ